MGADGPDVTWTQTGAMGGAKVHPKDWSYGLFGCCSGPDCGVCCFVGSCFCCPCWWGDAMNKAKVGGCFPCGLGMYALLIYRTKAFTCDSIPLCQGAQKHR